MHKAEITVVKSALRHGNLKMGRVTFRELREECVRMEQTIQNICDILLLDSRYKDDRERLWARLCWDVYHIAFARISEDGRNHCRALKDANILSAMKVIIKIGRIK